MTVNPQPAAVPDQGTSPSLRQQTRRSHRPGYFWPRALPLLIRHIIKMTPWVTVISGCLASTAILAALAYVAHKYQHPLSQSTVRLTFLIAGATMAFVPRTLFRPLTQATPVPAWVVPAIQTLLAFAVLALTCWAQLSLMAYTIRGSVAGPAIYPLIAGLTGWSTIFVAVAACCDRSRFADVGGAIAAPVTFAVIALAWYVPVSHKFLVEPPATARAVTIAWYVIATAALALTYAAMRDHWRRYTRNRRRLSPLARNPS
jgi:hypothetical protein